jgi:hypothetical protein
MASGVRSGTKRRGTMTVGQLLETIANKTATTMHDVTNAVLSADVETVIGNILPPIAAVVVIAALLAVLGWVFHMFRVIALRLKHGIKTRVGFFD